MILKNRLYKYIISDRVKTKMVVYFFACMTVLSVLSCKIYKFHDTHVDPNVKTVKVNMIENRAQYINPQLSPQLTDKLRQKIVGQTRLTQTNSENADWDISGTITGYSFSTAAISGQREATNRLTVTVHIILVDRVKNKTTESDVNRNFDFSATQSIQQAEASLGDEMIRALTDEIFNKLFSDW